MVGTLAALHARINSDRENGLWMRVEWVSLRTAGLRVLGIHTWVLRAIGWMPMGSCTAWPWTARQCKLLQGSTVGDQLKRYRYGASSKSGVLLTSSRTMSQDENGEFGQGRSGACVAELHGSWTWKTAKLLALLACSEGAKSCIHHLRYSSDITKCSLGTSGTNKGQPCGYTKEQILCFTRKLGFKKISKPPLIQNM
jgi:hypothetical protein